MRVKTRIMREKRRERMTRMKMIVTRKPQRELQELPGMTVLSFSLKYVSLMTFC